MIYHLFNEKTGQYEKSIDYFDSRKPSGNYWIADTELSNVKKGAIKNAILVMIDPFQKNTAIMSPKEFTEHKIKLGIISLSLTEKVLDNGDIVLKTREEQIEDGTLSREALISEKKKAISSEAGNIIVSGFRTNANGRFYIYDTDLEDQFNIKYLADMCMDAPIRCKDEETGIKTFIPHKKEIIKSIIEQFGFYKSSILMKADNMRLELDTLATAKDVEAYQIKWS